MCKINCCVTRTQITQPAQIVIRPTRIEQTSELYRLNVVQNGPPDQQMIESSRTRVVENNTTPRQPYSPPQDDPMSRVAEPASQKRNGDDLDVEDLSRRTSHNVTPNGNTQPQNNDPTKWQTVIDKLKHYKEPEPLDNLPPATRRKLEPLGQTKPAWPASQISAF